MKTLKKILFFPLTRIVLGIIAILAVTFLGRLIGENAFAFLNSDYKELATTILTCLLVLIAYHHLFRVYEQREVVEVSTKHLGRNLVLGVGAGILLQLLVVGTIAVFGSVTIEDVSMSANLTKALSLSLFAGVVEEVLFRGILFRIVEESLGSIIALLISGLFFGLAHLGNDNSSLFAALAIALQAGILIGVTYMYTRDLWMAIGLHFAWNFILGGILGLAVSGFDMGESLLKMDIAGSEWLTGGAFGPENSIQAIVFGVGLAIVLWLQVRKRGEVVVPFWKRKEGV